MMNDDARPKKTKLEHLVMDMINTLELGMPE
jgi:hypothetical protein